MKDKVQKTREEVERLMNELIQEKEKGFGSDVDDACILELQNVLTYIDSLQEEPVSEELEEAANKFVKSYTKGGTKQSWLKEGYIAGANWQKTKDESTTEDLGEYINELSKQFPEVSFAKLSRIAVRVAKWQKEQMMTNAIDGYVIEDIEEGNGDFLLSCEYLPKNTGLVDQQKVKVIVIKGN